MGWPEIAELRGDVAEFARSFPTVGFEKSEIMLSPRRQHRTRPPAQFSGLPARALFDPICGGGGGSISNFWGSLPAHSLILFAAAVAVPSLFFKLRPCGA